MPAIQTSGETSSLRRVILNLWEHVYGQPIGELEDDIACCRLYFDPVARGHKLRERLAQLEPVPHELQSAAARLGDPLVVDAGGGRFLVGIEARLLLELLNVYTDGQGRFLAPIEAIHDFDRAALNVYRTWTRHRLDQTLALKDGRGDEVMQATSVGIVLALLVNRSNTPERAIGRLRRVDEVIHLAAAAFADKISTSRRRSEDEQRLKGGYWLTEARRRLADRLIVTDSSRSITSLVYVPVRHIHDVVEYLGRDLARRASISPSAIEIGFDNLVDAFRSRSALLASEGMAFERPADTVRLKTLLVEQFEKERARQ